MAKLQGEDRPTYVLSYPRPVRLIRLIMVALLTVAALVRWVQVWVAFLRPVIMAADTPGGALDALSTQPLRPLISAHVGLVLVAGALGFLYAFLPDLSLADEGLAVRTLTGWQAVPWRSINIVRIAHLEESDRWLVLAQGPWGRWTLWPRLVSACAGGGFEPGILFTSDIYDFKPLLQRLHSDVNQAVPDAIFDDEFFSLPAQLVLEPTSTLEGLVEQARHEGWPLSLSLQAMGAVAAGLVLCQLLVLILIGGAWWKPLALVGLCALEWIIGSLYLYALTEIFPAQYELREGLLLYPMAQISRALVALPMAMLITAGLNFLAAMLGLAGVVWAVILTAVLVQQMYHLKSMLPALAGGTLQALFQFIVLAIIFT